MTIELRSPACFCVSYGTHLLGLKADGPPFPHCVVVVVVVGGLGLARTAIATQEGGPSQLLWGPPMEGYLVSN